MTAQQLLHPERQTLEAFNLGRLEPAAVDEIERHLAECEPCCETLAGLQDDTFVSLVRDADTASNEPPASRGVDPTRVGGTLTGAEAGTIPPELAEHPRYRVLELLGSGGMGSVYRAEHRLMQRTVALKVVNPRLTEHPAAVERFQREVRAAARLNHPNIVTAHDAEQAGRLHFMVMEYVAGIDLAEVVGQRGPLPVAEACEYIRQAALGLEHAREQGMVHRDIKPQNLMVEGRGLRVEGNAAHLQPSTLNSPPSIKILDFGLAHFASEAATHGGLTEAGAIMGTPDYMAPEQARDAHAADIRADIYSLGCTLYFLLSGRPPFPRGSVVEKVMAHTERAPERLASIRSDIPPGLERVLDRMTAKSASQRYQTPAEVVRSLEPFATGAAPAGPGRKATRAAVAAAALLLLLAATVVTVATDKGTLRIQYPPDADVEVTVSRDGEIYATDRSSGTKVHRLPSGEYDVALKGDARFRLDKSEFTLTRGEDVVLKITRAEGSADPTDQERLQGRWHTQSVVGEDRHRTERSSLRFEGNRLLYYLADGADGVDSEGTFELDPSQQPKHIDITSEDGRRLTGIYKLTGDSLHLALAEPGEPRPDGFDFKTDVDVWALTRRERPRRARESAEASRRGGTEPAVVAGEIDFGRARDFDPGADIPVLSPFTSVEWQGDTPLVRVAGDQTRYELEAIGDRWSDWLPVEHIVAFAKRVPGNWQERFEEDLVQILKLMGREFWHVDLLVRHPETGVVKELEEVSMTRENREALHRARERGERGETRRGDGGKSAEREPASDNLVRNPGFEDRTESAKGLDYWIAVGRTTPIEPDASPFRDTTVAMHGEASARIEKPETAVPAAEAGFLQSIPDLPAGRLAVSGFIRTKDVEGAAAIKLRIVDPRKGPWPVLACETTPVKGTTAWTRYEISISVPEGTLGELGLVVQGTGTAWFDDIVVRPVVSLLDNGGFDLLDEAGRPAGWLPMGLGVEGVMLDDSSEVKHGGSASATITNTVGGLEPYNWRQEIDARKLRGQQLRLTGWAKTQDAGAAAVGVQLLDADGRFIAFHSTQHVYDFAGTADWKRFDLEFAVPSGTTRLAVLAMLSGKGQVWFDDFELAPTGVNDDRTPE